MNRDIINNFAKLKNDIKRKYDENTEFAKEFNSKLKDNNYLHDKESYDIEDKNK